VLFYGVRDPRLARSGLCVDLLEPFVDPADAVRLAADWDLDAHGLRELFDLIEVELGSAAHMN
jgi:hypothetical protein